MKASLLFRKYSKTPIFGHSNYRLFKRIPAVSGTSNDRGLTVVCSILSTIDLVYLFLEISSFKIIDTHISFYSRNTHLLPPKPKSSFCHLKRGIQVFHMNYILLPADKAANNVVVV